MKKISKAISLLFHPLLFPTLGTVLLLVVNPNLFGYLGQKVHIVWLFIVFALTFLFPLIWIFMMKRLEMIDSFELENANDRIIPFIATATFYLWATWMFKPSVTMKIPPNILLFYMMLGACLGIFIGFFINIFSKVSLHAIGAGSLIGLLLALMNYSTYDLRPALIALILLAGLIGTARLLLNAHTPRQIFIGYFIGFTGQFVAFTIIPRLLKFL